MGFENLGPGSGTENPRDPGSKTQDRNSSGARLVWDLKTRNRDSRSKLGALKLRDRDRNEPRDRNLEPRTRDWDPGSKIRDRNRKRKTRDRDTGSKLGNRKPGTGIRDHKPGTGIENPESGIEKPGPGLCVAARNPKPQKNR